VLTAEGVSDFCALQEALGRQGGSREMAFIAFGLLFLDGRDLRHLPLIERRAMLENLLAQLPTKSPVQFSGHVTGQGPEFFALACRRRLEGIISKRVNSPYRSGRSGDWQKVKCKRRQESVIGGYRHEVSDRPNLSSLLIGYYDRGGLIYAGGVGTGWSIQLGRSIMATLRHISLDTSPFVAVPRPDTKDAKWVEPRLVCEVEFTTWTRDGRVRHPSFKGMREDKAAKEVSARWRISPWIEYPLGKRSVRGVCPEGADALTGPPRERLSRRGGPLSLFDLALWDDPRCVLDRYRDRQAWPA
jgi:bifunctional non-homologous end joining protein LigD